MKLNLEKIPVLKQITKEEFVENYLKKQRPVVVKNFSQDWPAYQKWNLDYMKEIAGDKQVPLHDSRPIEAKKFNQPHAYMKMNEYVDLLKEKPTDFRIFLWNILKEIPALQKDFEYPDLGITFLKSLPTLFFGGFKSYTYMHYDIDLANIFHFHFEGKKQCILFDQEQSKYLYKLPNTLRTHGDIDFSDPDVKKWPELKNAKGHIANLEHGDMLYIPEGYWHYMKYITPGFSMSLRSIPKTPKYLAKAVYNIAVMMPVENIMRRTMGEKWIAWKNNHAEKKSYA
ncbi:cupin-like domain-containing protein [Flavicella sp.]|uniref:cupin-like domain-containing protein n=1 Tax=Flavicella sp. TaxID=2957742 RepID=UPI002617E84C|nr:cupin-like domain-containing protein [Flavicella sp.]MDG1805617.1 cupin-like domain-containing protein [Flavicella sp.]MDG2280699.1 cupin-like domain-containing protein [Flavicella sp.]